jgi:4-hydroxy-4-methyl-2-oxoglutarate aldolase
MIVPGSAEAGGAQTSSPCDDDAPVTASSAFPRLRSALVCDALDALGLRSQCLVGLTPLVAGMHASGPAFPLATVVVDAVPDVPYRGLLEGLDFVPPGAVVAISAHGRADVALWGELLSTICIARGGVGAVCAGPIRDASQIGALGFPVFATGRAPYDINCRLEVVGHGTPVSIGEVEIAPGDLLVADDDGVLVVPTAVIDEVVARVALKSQRESAFLAAVREGVLPSEAFARFGVL